MDFNSLPEKKSKSVEWSKQDHDCDRQIDHATEKRVAICEIALALLERFRPKMFHICRLQRIGSELIPFSRQSACR